MAYDKLLADRIRQSLKDRKTAFNEKEMFGGICFMVDDKMCIGIIKQELMVRIDPQQEADFFARNRCTKNGFYQTPHERLFVCYR